MSQNYSIAGAIVGLGHQASTFANNRAGAHEALNQIALHHALTSASMQQQHEHNLESMRVAHGYSTEASNAGREHTTSENALNRTHELEQTRLSGQNTVNEVNAKSSSHLNEAQFALKHAAPGSKVQAGHLSFTATTGPTTSQTAAKNRVNSRMRTARGRA
jgi:hypothetical protein